VKVNGTRVEDLAGTGLVTKQRYVVPLWASVLGVTFTFLGRTVWLALRWAVRAWVITVPMLLIALAYWYSGASAVVGLVALTLSGGLAWARRWPVSFSRLVVQRFRGTWRWYTAYRRGWHPAMDGTGLTRTTPSRQVYVPRVVKVRSTSVVDTLHVRLLHGQTPEELALVAEGLRHAYRAHRCKVVEDAPGQVRVVFYSRDPLTRSLPPITPARVPDLTALPVGMVEDGELFRLRLKGRQIFIAGASDTGKGSGIWSLVNALAPAVHAGLVELHGIDLKRMELVFAPEMFTRLEVRLREAVELLEADAEAMARRQDRLSGVQRDHTATVGDPTVVIVIDELAALSSYHTQRDLKKRAEAALSLLLSQGRAVGYHVIAAAQDPRKDVVQFRDLFNLRVALRVTESSHVDMLLGDGARDLGATCDRIPDTLPGVGYTIAEGRPDAVRIRFTYLSDDDIRAMATRWPAPRNTIRRDAPAVADARVPDPRTNLTHEREE
jgi:DNA segregation ATPase FtsK/SpoIIIE, S-DNA-T family